MYFFWCFFLIAWEYSCPEVVQNKRTYWLSIKN
jgi:hypothetical protein